MTQTLPLKIVREQLSDLVSRVAYGDQKVVITKFGKPVAALVTFDDYEKVINPAKRFTKKEWDKFFVFTDKIKSRMSKNDQEDLENIIDKEVKAVRAERQQKAL